jgi:tRNA G46 methylase TrmB
MGMITVGTNIKLESPDKVFKFFKTNFNANIFFETGTYLGETTVKSSYIFEKVYTVELSKELFNNALTKFKNLDLKNIIIYNENSELITKQYCSNCKDRTVFWLDAHYSAGKTSGGDLENPLLKELEYILKSDTEHFIIIDDVRYILTNFQESICKFPNIVDISKVILEYNNDRYDISIFNDCIFLVPKYAFKKFKEFIVKESLINDIYIQ